MHNKSEVTLVCGSYVLRATPVSLTRGLVNLLDIILLNASGTALDITDVATWDLGITEDFIGETGVLAGSSTITADESVLSVTLNMHTEELAAKMNGKTSIQAFATLRGRDSSLNLKRIYVFPVVVLNIGFTNDTVLSKAAEELTYTKAQIDYLLSQIPGADGAEFKANKTQEIDYEDPSEEKYPSESAVVSELNKKVNAEVGKSLFSGSYADLANKPTIATDIKDLSDSTGILSGKVDKVEGKALSTNDYTDDDKTKVSNALTSVPDATTSVKGIMQLATSGDTTSTDKAVTPKILADGISGKVDVVSGKDLSTNDFTDAYKTKVDADVESVTALPSPAVSLLSRVYFLTADDGTKKKGTTWKCVADGETYIFQQIQTDLNQLTDTTGILAGKVDVVAGKELSDNNFTTAEKNKLESALTSIPDASTTVKGAVQIATGEEVTAGTDDKKAIVPATLKTELDKKANTSAIPDITGKVDRVEGKALSTNDFTDAYKTKVDADVESVTALPSPAVSLLNRVYFLTADDGTKKKGTTWKCVADGETYIFQQIQTDLNQLTDATGLFAAKVDKVTGYGLSKNDYTDAAVAKVAKIDLETLTELTGADVTIAPWTQSKWSASGVCTITATGWAASGFQWSQIVITVLADATPAIAGTEELSEDDALSGAGVYHAAFINLDGKIYFHVSSFVPAEAEE